MMADDYYQNGWDIGYGRGMKPGGEYPMTDCDRYSFERGLEDGQRRAEVGRELDREMYGDSA